MCEKKLEPHEANETGAVCRVPASRRVAWNPWDVCSNCIERVLPDRDAHRVPVLRFEWFKSLAVVHLSALRCSQRLIRSRAPRQFNKWIAGSQVLPANGQHPAHRVRGSQLHPDVRHLQKKTAWLCWITRKRSLLPGDIKQLNPKPPPGLFSGVTRIDQPEPNNPRVDVSWPNQPVKRNNQGGRLYCPRVYSVAPDRFKK